MPQLLCLDLLNPIFLSPLPIQSKLEGYQDLRISGKNLTADQEVAISKYEEVVQCLLCAQEFLKQIQGIAVVWDKEQKNALRKVCGKEFPFVYVPVLIPPSFAHFSFP